MRSWSASMLACALMVSAPVAHSAARIDASIAAFADSDEGSSLDADISVAPNEWLTLSAGLGTSRTSEEAADLDGDAWRLSIDAHSERFGIRGYHSNWADSSQFESATTGVRAYLRHGGFTFELIGEARTLDVGFTVRLLPGRPTRVERSIDGTGAGIAVSYYGGRWGGYVEGVFYDYDSSFDQLIEASRAPNIDRFPRIQALVGSLLTLTQGATDSEIAAGLERSAARSSVRLDWVHVEEAFEGLQANSLSLSFLYSFTRHVDLELTLGASDSERLGTTGFGGVTLGLHR